jgi:hypothetical protein
MFPERLFRQLSEKIIACRDEGQVVILVQDLQIALHEHVEQLRAKLTLPSSFDSISDIEAA